MGGSYHEHRPGSVLAATPFVETLPTPHNVHPIPPPLPADSGIPDPNYYANYPSYKFRSAPYIPQHLRPLLEEDDPDMYSVSNQTAHAWTRPSWGWVGFRTDNSITEEEWAKVRKRIWERYKFQSYSEPEKFRILWIALDPESRGKVEGRESLAEFEVVRSAFQQWLTAHQSDPAYESYEPNFCLVADTRSCQEILRDVDSRPTLPEKDPGLTASRTDTTLIVLDRRTPENPNAQPDDADEYETDFGDAEGQYDEKGYRGYLRSSLDDVAFLWGDVGNGDPQEVVLKYARKARAQTGGVFTYWHCT